ncbi:DUF1269 domain-containing protein [Acidovorax sp. A1169]|uniref:general stress protein n=1 Tax=Acidovorax sp. A1169 TaxID=3059524 RepID=UPI00273792D2|nr:DUF1269 domain-containing protein [Acidovorax sp. A1169]MDP4076390.1 DUF1269 domain-containing protein [Acidovorax sp. A1169]
MTNPKPNVFLFDTHAAAEDAIRALAKSGFDLRQLSLVGKGYHSEEKPTGFYTVGDRIKSWGSTGAFWGSIWGMLLAPAVFLLPGLGVVAMAGPFAAALIAALEGAVVVGGVSALGAALTQIGMPKDQAIKYEAALKVDKYLLLVHGDASAQAIAQTVLGQMKSEIVV